MRITWQTISYNYQKAFVSPQNKTRYWLMATHWTLPHSIIAAMEFAERLKLIRIL